jgi:hypothetical protein
VTGQGHDPTFDGNTNVRGIYTRFEFELIQDILSQLQITHDRLLFLPAKPHLAK